MLADSLARYAHVGIALTAGRQEGCPLLINRLTIRFAAVDQIGLSIRLDYTWRRVSCGQGH